MTPFMIAVREVLDGQAAPGPAVTASALVSAPAGANAQVAVRALAEQLVCEANAVLRDAGDGTAVISLVDECGPGALVFTLGYRNRSAQIRTDFRGRDALASLLVPGVVSPPRTLASEDEVRALVLSLIDDS
ncbi:MAG: hypothetical protein ACRDN0_36300 [Trebonia sp.]